jgi:hypothetical protein
VITLEAADLVVIAGRTLGLGTGQVLDLLDAEGRCSAWPWVSSRRRTTAVRRRTARMG